MKTKNILIPTDFSLPSLNAVTSLLQRQPGQKFNITMVHFLQLSDSITELLMLSRRSREYQQISDDFNTQFNALKGLYPDQIDLLNIEFFYGSTVAVFKNYLGAKEVDMIVMLENYPYGQLMANSIDPGILVQRSGYPVLGIAPQPKPQGARIGRSVDFELQHA